MKRLLAIFAALFVAVTSVTAAGEQPRLVVNIVVSGLSSSAIERYGAGFGKGGFNLLMEGVSWPYAYYPFAPETTSALATLSTGAMPSLHGVVGEAWWNYTDSKRVGALYDPASSSYNADSQESRVSNANLSLETLGDVLVGSTPDAKSVAVATKASSAIILGGLHPTQVWWLDEQSGTWTTSTKYLASLPKWVGSFNRSGYWRSQYGQPWILSRSKERYKNEKTLVAKPYGYRLTKEEKREKPSSADIAELIDYSHVANDVVVQFAKEAIIYNKLGADKTTDLLSVCFDTPRGVIERYGLSSREVEDMYYRLDESLAELIHFASAQAGGKVLFVLSSDGGVRAAEWDEQERVFNDEQARFLISSFLSATYGKGDWVLGLERGGLWLNHTLILSRGLDLESVRQRVATFALQLRGVSHAITAADMASGGIKNGIVEIVQNGFYPKRSADVVLVMMPDWREIRSEEESPALISSSLPYAPYRRTFVALAGWGVEQQGEVVSRKVDVRSLVVTLARMLSLEVPMGADCEPLF